MKKLIVIIGILIIFSMANVVVADVTIVVDEEVVEFTEEYGIPFIDENDRTQVPLRTALEYFGAEVGWVHETFTATVLYNNIFIEVPIGKKYIIVNGKIVENDTVALIKNSRTYLPLRVVFENLGAKVTWEGTSNSVLVEKEPEVSVVIGTEIGDKAADFDVVDQFNQTVSLEALLGHKVILTFYTTW